MASLALAFDILAKDNASKTFDKVGRSARNTADDFDKADKASGRLAKSSVAIGSAIGGLAAGGLLAGLSAVKNFASGSIEAFAAVEDSTGAAGVQFGKALPQVEKFAEGAFKAFGLSTRAALDAQNEFGTLGKSAGLTGTDLAGFSGKLTGLAGDLASFKGTSTEQAIGAVGAALRGENEPLRAYGVLLDDATLRQEALALGLTTTTKTALTPQQKVLAAQSAILKQTSDAQGDFSRTSDSTANTQKRLQAATENASAQLGEKLAPIVTEVRRKFIDFITALTDTEGVTQRKIVPALQAMGDKLLAVRDFVQRNSDVILPLVGTLGTFAGGIIIVTQVVKAYTAVQAALNLVLAANPVGLVILAIAALVTGIVIAYQKSETFRTILQSVFRESAQAVLGAVDKMLATLQTLFEGASKIPGIGDKFKGVSERIQGTRDKIGAVDGALDAIGRKKVFPSIALAGVGQVEEDLIRLEKRFTNIGGVQVRIPVRRDQEMGDGPGRVGGSTLNRVKGLLGAGTYVTSTLRSASQNAAVGGSPRSYHLDRNNPAVDIGGSTSALNALHARLQAIGGWRELLWQVPNHYDHVHVAHDGGQVSKSWPTMPGLRSDERPVIAQVGETIIPKGGSGATYTINTAESDPVRILSLLRRMETLNA